MKTSNIDIPACRTRDRAARMSAVGLIAIAGLVATSAPAAAYIGPGLGLGVIASIFGAIAAFFMMIAGLVWYPVKIMLRKRKAKNAAAADSSAETSTAMPATPAPDAATKPDA